MKLRGFATKVYKERIRPEVQSLTLLYTIFDRKGTPWLYLLLAMQVIPFTCLAQNFASLLTTVNTLLKYELGYLKDSNAAAHSVDTGFSQAVGLKRIENDIECWKVLE